MGLGKGYRKKDTLFNRCIVSRVSTFKTLLKMGEYLYHFEPAWRVSSHKQNYTKD